MVRPSGCPDRLGSGVVLTPCVLDPIDYAIPRGWPICVLAYLDGTGDTENGRAAQEFVALASIAAYKERWDSGLHDEWDGLIALNGGEPIHATELHHEGAIDILEKAVRIVASLDRELFHMFGCIVSLADYQRALPLCPALLEPPHDNQAKPPEAICVDWCVGGLFDRLDVDYDKGAPNDMGVVFDANERFLRWIYRVWTAPHEIRPWWARKRDRRDRSDWLRPRIVTIVPGDSDRYRELQAADVIAWAMRRHHTNGDRDDWYNAIRIGREADFRHWTLKRLLVKYAPDRPL